MSYDNINNYLSKLSSSKNEEENTIMAIELANEVLKIFGAPQNELKYGEDVLNEAFPSRKFKHQKMESWFAKHPYMSSARVALTHFQGLKIPVETKFYRLSDSANKAKISATTQIDSNWEDSNLTMRPQYKVGIDFFLNAEGTALLIVLTNKGNLRVLELNEKLSKTQIEIFEKVKGCFLFDGINPKTGLVEEFEPQRTIHKNLWNSFALQEVNKKFYLGIAEHFEELVQHIHRNIPENVSEMTVKNDAKLFATRLLGRLLFLWFLKKRNLISEKFHYFSVDDENSTDYYENKLKKLFFSVLNTPNKERSHQDFETPYLNGGLFDAHPNDWADKIVSFPTNWFASLYEHFNSFNFTTDESSPDYEQIAIDPEMLGRVFENLLATIVPETSQAASEKKNKGAFYTPREIVDYMSKESLKEYLKKYNKNSKDDIGIEKIIDLNDADFLVLKSTGALNLWGNRTQEVRSNLIEALNKLKVLDPACGSGAFPMGLLQLIVRTYDRLSAYYDYNLKTHRPIRPTEKNDVYATKLAIIQNNLFGSDIEPMAIEISRLRSWLSLVIDDKGEIEPLPNLDFNFVCANSLISLEQPIQINMFENLEYEMEIKKLRDEYFQTHDLKSKLLLKSRFATLYKTNIGIDAETRRIQQLRSWNPFEADKPAEFYNSKIMFNVDGFDIIIGNPPYIGEKGHKDIFHKVKNSNLGKRFYLGKMDYFYFFYHLALDNAVENSIISFITTNYFLTADGALNLRKDFYNRASILKLIDFNEVNVFDSAKGQHDVITIMKKGVFEDVETEIYSFKEKGKNYLTNLSDLKNTTGIAYKKINNRNIYDGEKLYIRLDLHKSLNNEELTDILFKIQNKRLLLGDLCSINQGIISGADKVSPNHIKRYKINAQKGDGIFVLKSSEIDDLKIEEKYLKPWFKNSDIGKYIVNEKTKEFLIYIQGNLENHTATYKHISKFEDLLRSRGGLKNDSDNWYQLWRKREVSIFEDEKIVAPQRSKTNTFGYVRNIDWYASADVYFITKKIEEIDLKFLLGILNSKLIYFWLYNRGKRKGQMLELYYQPLSEIPIPNCDENMQWIISSLVEEIISNKLLKNDTTILENKLDSLIFELYSLDNIEIDFILNFAKKGV